MNKVNFNAFYFTAATTVVLTLFFSTSAFANLPTYGKGGDNKSKPDPALFPEKEWVIVEVIDEQPAEAENSTPVVNIEKKNISQVPVTKIEVRNCKQNNVPDELAPLMQQIPGGRKVYKSEENGRTVYYISPVQEPQQEKKKEADPSSLTFPLFQNLKI